LRPLQLAHTVIRISSDSQPFSDFQVKIAQRDLSFLPFGDKDDSPRF
jgi:hypothetical protein